MTCQHVRAGFVAAMLVLAGPTVAGPLDPDCSVAKAARGAATKAVVGVRGNRCDAAETARDALGVDDEDRLDDRDRIGDGDRIDDRDRNRNDNDRVLNKARND